MTRAGVKGVFMLTSLSGLLSATPRLKGDSRNSGLLSAWPNQSQTLLPYGGRIISGRVTRLRRYEPGRRHTDPYNIAAPGCFTELTRRLLLFLLGAGGSACSRSRSRLTGVPGGRADESIDRLAGGEDPDRVGAAPELLVRSLVGLLDQM